jgi:hypothetical protein
MMGGIGQMIFGMIFNFALMMLFAPKPKDTVTYGPRLDNLKPAVKDIQGQIINLTYGITRISGTVFWASDIRETEHRDTTEYSSKGGGGSYTHTDVTYTYDCDIAVGICEGPILGIRKIWANKDLIYNTEQKPNYVSWLKWRFYEGTETQKPDPILEANFGTDLTPAHRGLAYVVFEQFQLDPFGRRIPQSIEFEVVAKGVVTGSASKYTQLDYNTFGDYGDNEVTQVVNTMLMLNYNTLVIPILNWSANNYNGDSGFPSRYAYVNLSTSTVTKYAVYSGTTWAGNWIGYGTWVSGMSIGGWHRHINNFAWMQLNWGRGYRYVPVYIQGCSYDVSQNDYSYWQVFNIINGRMVGHGWLNGSYVGSFTDFYFGGIGNNCLYTYQINNSDPIIYEHNISEVTRQGIYENPEGYDEFGFPKTILNLSLGYNEEVVFPVTRTPINGPTVWKDHLRFYLVGFPEEIETIEYTDYDPITEPYKTVITRQYDITTWSLGIGNRLDILYYENCTYNILDGMEHGIVAYGKVSITTNTKNYYKYKPFTESTTNVEYTCPAEQGPHFGPYDADPLPPQDIPPYDKHVTLQTKKTVFIHYIPGTTSTWTGFPSMWLRFTNGSELVCLHNKLYKKDPFSSTFPNSYQEWLEQNPDVENDIDSYMEWQLYSSISLVNDTRITRPNNLFTEYSERYKLGELGSYVEAPSGAHYYNLNNNPSIYGHNNAPFYFVGDISIPSTYYYQPGATKIYWNSGGTIYSMNLSTFEILTEVTSAAAPYQIMPYSGDFIGFRGSINMGYSGPYGDLWYIQKQVVGSAALLGEIIVDISNKAGISEDVLDISDKAYNIQVNGYNISDDIKLIDALETLLMHYFIDAYESEWKIKFKTRKEALEHIATIDSDELGVRELGEKYNEKYKITIREDTELPQSVTYNYISVDNGYSQANVIALRNIDFNLGIKTTIKAPLALYTNEAYSNAFRILFDLWRSTKEFEFRLPNSYSYIEPGDVVLLPIDTNDITNEYIAVKISEISAQSNLYIELKGIEEDARNTEGMISQDGAYETFISTMLPESETKLVVLDSKPLYNKFNNTYYNEPGIYVGAYSDNKYWQGGSLFGSFDDTTYARSIDFNVPGSIGGIIYSITNYLVDPHHIDTINNVTIQVTSYQDFYEPADYDYDYLEDGLIGIISTSTGHIEYLQYKTISYINEANNNKMIKFTNLRRGLYNSYNYNAGFTINDKVILLPKGCHKLNIATNYYNSVLYYKGVSFGQSVDSTIGSPYKYKLNWYLPYNVANLKAVTSGSDILVSWVQTERGKSSYLLTSPTELDALEYTVEIYNNDSLVRSEIVTTNSYTYTAAKMVTDSTTIYNNLRFRVKRKATFLEYNHSIYDDIYFVPSVDTATILLNKYPTASDILYINFESQNNVIINTNNNTKYAITYNNYNGKNRLNTSRSMLGLACANLTGYEYFNFAGITPTTTYSAYMILKINTPSGYVPPICLNDNTYGYLTSISWDGATARFENTNGYCGMYLRADLPLGEWLFIAWAQNGSGNIKRSYVRSLTTANVNYIGSTSWCSGGGGSLPYSGKLFFNTGGINYDLQEFCIIGGKDLYVENNNTYSGFEQLYNIGKKKWLQR